MYDEFEMKLATNFNTNEPILSEEILSLFKEYSKAQVFRYIDKAKKEKKLVQFSTGVYYIPTITFWGDLSTISADSVIEKKYLKNDNDTYGIYGGIKLLNNFSITTQMAAIIEVVTNNEKTRQRKIEINKRKFILKKSRCQINKNNYAAYTILQLFNDFSKQDQLDQQSREKIIEFIKNSQVTKNQLIELSVNFPSIAVKNLIRSDILNEIAQ